MTQEIQGIVLGRKAAIFIALFVSAVVGVLFLSVNVAQAATTVGNNASVGGTLAVTGAVTMNGAVTLGDATSDTVTFTGYVSSNVLPSADATYNLGAFANAWNNIYASGTLYVAGVSSTRGMYPTATNSYDVGGFALAWKNVYSSGTAFIAALTVDGNTTLGNATGDTVTFTGRVASHVLPSADATYNLGAFANAWNDVYSSGTAYIAALTVDGNTTLGNATGDTVTFTGRVASHVLPSANTTYNLGAYANAWNNVFASNTLYVASSTMVNRDTTSTIILRSDVAARGGRIILENSDGTTCTQMYFRTSASDMVTSTITCPE